MAKDAPKKEEEKDEKKEEAPKKGKDAKEGAAEGEAKEGAEGEAAEGEAAPKKSKKKIIIFGVLALVILLGGGAGAYFAFSKHADKGEAAAGADGKTPEKPLYYSLPEFLVNLNTSGKQTSYLKTTIVLELTKPEDTPLIEANLPRIQDAINSYLRELRASDLSGSAGVQRLREEVLTRVNTTIAPAKISKVYFKEIIVQ